MKVKLIIALCLLEYTGMCQSLTLRKLIDATHCRNDACFSAAIQADSMCFERTFTNETGTFFRYKNCKEGTPDNRLIIHFAILKDGHFNSSFLTWSETYNRKLLKELDAYEFRKIENPEDPNKDRIWYHSAHYEHMNIMLETLADDKGTKRWHIGLVWE